MYTDGKKMMIFDWYLIFIFIRYFFRRENQNTKIYND
jgi:hypothetical protein